jgi:hypothetical protein
VEPRRRTGWGPRALSAALGWPASTIWRVLKRYDCSGAERAPRPSANRYEYAAPGELVHLDIKQLGRSWQIGKRMLGDGVQRSRHAGWSYAHVAGDDHSRLAHGPTHQPRLTRYGVLHLGREVSTEALASRQRMSQ